MSDGAVMLGYLEEYVPTKIVEDPNMPVGGGVFFDPAVFQALTNIGGQGSYQLGKEMTEKMFGGQVEPGPEEHPAQVLPPCPKCEKSMVVDLDIDETPIWHCLACQEKYPRFLDGMSTVQEAKDRADRALAEVDAEVKRAAKINDVEVMLLRWRYGSAEQQSIDARELASLIVRRLS